MATKYEVAHIDLDQYRFLRSLVQDGAVEASIVIQRIATVLPVSPVAAQDDSDTGDDR